MISLTLLPFNSLKNISGDLTDVTSSGETEMSPLITRQDQPLLSPQYATQTTSTIVLPNTRSKVITDQWLSSETLGHRPRSYSADIPSGGGRDLLSKYRLIKGVISDSSEKATVDESEFGSKDQYTRRYSISVAREARKPRVIPTPEWNALGLPTNSKWPEAESSDQPMDLSVSRDLSKYKPAYSGSNLLSVVTQEELVPDRHLQTSLESCLNEQYQLKSLPVLSPQVVVDYDATSVDSSSGETAMISLTDDQNVFSSVNSSSRSVYYMQDVPATENASGKKEGEVTEDPPSPEIDYSACSPVSPTNLEENTYYFSQENLGQGSLSSEEVQSASRAHAEFIVPSSSSSMEEGKCVCRICNKIFAKSSHLRLHVNIHYFERPFRCDNCAVSFRTKGHLQKHKRSVSHYNKVNMNLTFGTPTVDNPRPFKCADCKIAFRIHGHLAKHLRSKMHIMKLECLGKLPFGMYAEMERSGVSLNEIDTTDCNNSLESLQVMAQKLYQRDPRRMRWQGPEQSTIETECAMPAPTVASTLLEPILPIGESIPTTFDPNCSTIALSSLPSLTSSKHLSEGNDVKNESSEVDPLRIPSAYTDGDSAISLSRYVISQPVTTASQETNQRVEVPENDSSVSLNRSGTCHMCGRLFKSAKFLQVHLYSDHSSVITSVSDTTPPSNSSVSSVASSEMNCDLCGKMFPNQKALQQVR